MSLVETRSRDENILRYCHPKKCIPWCIDRAVNTPFLWRCIRFQSIRRRRHCRFNIGFDMEGEQLNVSNQWISRKIIWLLQFKLMRMDILYIYILQIIIKCDWTLNEAIHAIFVKHLKCIKCIARVYFDYNVYLLVSTEIIEYIVQRSPGIWNV